MRKLKVPDSSNIAAVAYDVAHALMQVEFTDGSTYQYHMVTPRDFAELCSAPSMGHWFAVNIKPFPEAFPYKKLQPEPQTEKKER